MFGNAITSSWANPQQNQQQQQQQQPSAFGQPSTFGSTGFGGGGTSAFGQPQQQQANPMFGNLGGAGTNPGASGFGKCELLSRLCSRPHSCNRRVFE
ncbi:hypothetical protein K435DRAFT_2846 [Dendrothele bispora CBS 962.96]|uniref:Uncharacterized protein n=1 Tax=Dendrothele bispora (strain CBS 962.96) TaxID=1314807 RepID=A0A4S8MYE3_DENBC|nr:hypothetical protein K435DRAFT_2846 [Dendrothele bispora CBS 962.96]